MNIEEKENSLRSGFATGMCVLIVALLGLGLRSLQPAAAQEDALQATISALETRVTQLETQVAGGSPVATVAEGAGTPASAAETGVYGNAAGLLSPGEAGTLSVVATGVFQEGSVPVVVRNNTDQPLARVQIIGDVRGAEGRVTQPVSGSQFKPLIVVPGGLAIGTALFGSAVKDTDTVSLTTKADKNLWFWSGRGPITMELVEFNNLGDRITGSIRNPSSKVTTDRAYLQLMCFDESGAPTWTDAESVDEGIAPGDIASFEFGLLGGIRVPCDRYLFAGYSYTG